MNKHIFNTTVLVVFLLIMISILSSRTIVMINASSPSNDDDYIFNETNLPPPDGINNLIARSLTFRNILHYDIIIKNTIVDNITFTGCENISVHISDLQCATANYLSDKYFPPGLIFLFFYSTCIEFTSSNDMFRNVSFHNIVADLEHKPYTGIFSVIRFAGGMDFLHDDDNAGNFYGLKLSHIGVRNAHCRWDCSLKVVELEAARHCLFMDADHLFIEHVFAIYRSGSTSIALLSATSDLSSAYVATSTASANSINKEDYSIKFLNSHITNVTIDEPTPVTSASPNYVWLVRMRRVSNFFTIIIANNTLSEISVPRLSERLYIHGFEFAGNIFVAEDKDGKAIGQFLLRNNSIVKVNAENFDSVVVAVAEFGIFNDVATSGFNLVEMIENALRDIRVSGKNCLIRALYLNKGVRATVPTTAASSMNFVRTLLLDSNVVRAVEVRSSSTSSIACIMLTDFVFGFDHFIINRTIVEDILLATRNSAAMEQLLPVTLYSTPITARSASVDPFYNNALSSSSVSSSRSSLFYVGNVRTSNVTIEVNRVLFAPLFGNTGNHIKLFDRMLIENIYLQNSTCTVGSGQTEIYAAQLRSSEISSSSSSSSSAFIVRNVHIDDLNISGDVVVIVGGFEIGSWSDASSSIWNFTNVLFENISMSQIDAKVQVGAVCRTLRFDSDLRLVSHQDTRETSTVTTSASSSSPPSITINNIMLQDSLFHVERNPSAANIVFMGNIDMAEYPVVRIQKITVRNCDIRSSAGSSVGEITALSAKAIHVTNDNASPPPSSSSSYFLCEDFLLSNVTFLNKEATTSLIGFYVKDPIEGVHHVIVRNITFRDSVVSCASGADSETRFVGIYAFMIADPVVGFRTASSSWRFSNMTIENIMSPYGRLLNVIVARFGGDVSKFQELEVSSSVIHNISFTERITTGILEIRHDVNTIDSVLVTNCSVSIFNQVPSLTPSSSSSSSSLPLTSSYRILRYRFFASDDNKTNNNNLIMQTASVVRVVDCTTTVTVSSSMTNPHATDHIVDFAWIRAASSAVSLTKRSLRLSLENCFVNASIPPTSFPADTNGTFVAMMSAEREVLTAAPSTSPTSVSFFISDGTLKNAPNSLTQSRTAFALVFLTPDENENPSYFTTSTFEMTGNKINSNFENEKTLVDVSHNNFIRTINGEETLATIPRNTSFKFGCNGYRPKAWKHFKSVLETQIDSTLNVDVSMCRPTPTASSSRSASSEITQTSFTPDVTLTETIEETFSRSPSEGTETYSPQITTSTSATNHHISLTATSSHELSASNSVTRSDATQSQSALTPTDSKPIDTSFGLNQEVLAATVATAQSLTALASVAGGAPTAALSLARSISVLQLLGCPAFTPDGERWPNVDPGFSWTLLPTVKFGSDDGGYYRTGAVVFAGICLILIFVGTVLATDPVGGENDSSSSSSSRGGRVFNFLALAIFTFCGQFVSVAGVMLAVAIEKTSSAVDFVIGVSPFVFILPLLYVGFKRVFLSIKRKPKITFKQPILEINSRTKEEKFRLEKVTTYNVVPYHLVPCFIVKKRESNDKKDNSTTSSSRLRHALSWLKSPPGRFFLIGDYCWVQDPDDARLMLQKRNNVLNVDKSDTKTDKTNNQNDLVSFLITIPRLFADLRGPVKVNTDLLLLGLSSGGDDRGLAIDAESLFYRLPPFYILISIIAVVVCGYLQGLSKGFSNEPGVCRIAIWMNCLISLSMAVLTLYLRPFIVPFTNIMSIILEVCSAFVAISVLFLTESTTETPQSMTKFIQGIQLLVVGVGMFAGLLAIAVRGSSIVLMNSNELELVSEDEMWRRKEEEDLQERRNMNDDEEEEQEMTHVTPSASSGREDDEFLMHTSSPVLSTMGKKRKPIVVKKPKKIVKVPKKRRNEKNDEQEQDYQFRLDDYENSASRNLL